MVHRLGGFFLGGGVWLSKHTQCVIFEPKGCFRANADDAPSLSGYKDLPTAPSWDLCKTIAWYGRGAP